jgi:hypothetical protein
MGWLSRLNPFAPAPTDAAKAIRVLESRLEKLTKESLEPIDPPFLKPSDYYDDWYPERRAFPRGYPQDKKYGENWPIIRHEEDLRLARGTSRLLSETNPLCIGFLNHVTNFVVGSGFKWHVGLKGQKGDKDNKDPAVIEGQRFLDDFRALNGWGDTGEVSVGDGTDDDDSPSTDLEAEAYSSAMSDGEFFLRLFPGDGSTNGVPMVRRVNPECVYCPPGEMQQGPWSFGIETDPDDRQRRLNYHVADPDDYPANGEIVRAGEIVHLKLNSVSDVKRGVPDFWPLEHEARHIRKLWQNMSEVSAILSAIAYIRQHAAGVTGTQISRIVDATATGRDFRVPLSGDRAGGDSYRSYTRMDGGTVIDVTNGQEWVPPPIAAGIPGFTQAMQATLRIFGLRWGCPEYFSGDASNANFASTLVAGGPFERATQRRQRQFRIFQGNLASRVLLFGVKAGRLKREDVQRLSIAIDPPAVAIANKSEDTSRRATLNQAGVLSVRTWAAEEGLDPEAEAAQIKAEKAAAEPPPGMGGGGPGAPVPGGEPQPDAGGGMDLATLLGEDKRRVSKAVRESFNETDHPRDDNGRFVSGSDVADAKGDPAKEKALRDRVTDPEQRAKLDAELGGGAKSGPTPQEAAADRLYAAEYETWGKIEGNLESDIDTPEALARATDEVDENRRMLDQFAYELADTLAEIGASDKAVDGVRAVLKKGLPVVDKLGEQYKAAAAELLATNRAMEAAEREESEYEYQAEEDDPEPEEDGEPVEPPDPNDYRYDITQDDDAPDVPDKPDQADYKYDIGTDSNAPPDPDDTEPAEPAPDADEEEWDAYYAARDEWQADYKAAKEERAEYEAEQKAKAKAKYKAAKAEYKAAVKARDQYEAEKTAEWDAKYDAAAEAHEAGRRPVKPPPPVDRTPELQAATKAAQKAVAAAERKTAAVVYRYDQAVSDLEGRLHDYATTQAEKVDYPMSESVITEATPTTEAVEQPDPEADDVTDAGLVSMAMLKAKLTGDDDLIDQLAELADDPDGLQSLLDELAIASAPKEEAEGPGRTPPRPGLVWKDATKRWVRDPEAGGVKKPKAGAAEPKAKAPTKAQQAKATKAANMATAKDAVQAALADPSSVQPEQLSQLAGHLKTMTVAELKGHLQGVIGKVPKTKGAIVDRLIEHVKGGGGAKPAGKPDITSHSDDELRAEFERRFGKVSAPAERPAEQPAPAPRQQQPKAEPKRAELPEAAKAVVADVEQHIRQWANGGEWQQRYDEANEAGSIDQMYADHQQRVSALMGQLDAAGLSGQQWKDIGQRVAGYRDKTGAAARLSVLDKLTQPIRILIGRKL